MLQEMLSAPRRMACVAPSSRFLAAAMARWVTPTPATYVVELGPGTGAVTEALFDRGLEVARLVAIEKSPVMAELLRQRFPAAQIILGDACHLTRLLRRVVAEPIAVGAVVSSLPLRQFTPRDTERLARQIHEILPAGGRWIQYSYHLGKERPKGSSRFQVRHSEVVWLNLPPARVTVYEK